MLRGIVTELDEGSNDQLVFLDEAKRVFLEQGGTRYNFLFVASQASAASQIGVLRRPDAKKLLSDQCTMDVFQRGIPRESI